MSAFVVDISISLTMEEFNKFKLLSELESKPLPECVMECMNIQCDKRLEELDAATK